MSMFISNMMNSEVKQNLNNEKGFEKYPNQDFIKEIQQMIKMFF